MFVCSIHSFKFLSLHSVFHTREKRKKGVCCSASVPASPLYTRTRASFFFFFVIQMSIQLITYYLFFLSLFFCYVFFCCCCCSLFSRRLCCPLSLSTKRKGKKIEFLPLLELVSNEDPEKHGVFGGCRWKQLIWVPSATEVNVFLFFFGSHAHKKCMRVVNDQ